MKNIMLETLIESILIMVNNYEKAHNCKLWIDDGNFYPHLTTILENQVREGRLLKTKEN